MRRMLVRVTEERDALIARVEARQDTDRERHLRLLVEALRSRVAALSAALVMGTGDS